MDENIEVKRVDVFDLDYKGCRGCLGCQMKRTVEVGCVVKDGAHDLLKEIRTADGLVFATPIYFMDVSPSELIQFSDRSTGLKPLDIWAFGRWLPLGGLLFCPEIRGRGAERVHTI